MSANRSTRGEYLLSEGGRRLSYDGQAVPHHRTARARKKERGGLEHRPESRECEPALALLRGHGWKWSEHMPARIHPSHCGGQATTVRRVGTVLVTRVRLFLLNPRSEDDVGAVCKSRTNLPADRARVVSGIYASKPFVHRTYKTRSDPLHAYGRVLTRAERVVAGGETAVDEQCRRYCDYLKNGSGGKRTGPNTTPR
jgi:hypothetical protein